MTGVVSRRGPRFAALFCLAVICPWSKAPAEVGAGQIQSWLEQGDKYLAENRYESARGEFDKVLDAIPPQQRPAILQKVARCYYQEDNVDATIITLQRAVLLAPHSSVNRQLLTLTLENVGMGVEVRKWLARLDRDGPAALATELGTDLPEDERQFLQARASIEPPEPGTPHRTGAFRTAFSERNPLSSMEIYRERFELTREAVAQSDPAGGEYNLAKESFEVFVPDTYDREEPAGLLVWVSPANSGRLSRPENLEVLAEKNLIWIGANNSGNDRWNSYRTGLALDAAHNMAELYNTDPERIYVSGYSGGGRVASSLALLYPEVFRGGAFFFGCNFFREVDVPGNPGAVWRAKFPPPSTSNIDSLHQDHRFVLITGELDFNRAETKAYSKEYKREGFENITYIEIPDAQHGYGVRGVWLKKVIEALDGSED